MLEVKQIEQLIEKGSLFINFECDEKTAFELLESLRPMIKSQSSVVLLKKEHLYLELKVKEYIQYLIDILESSMKCESVLNILEMEAIKNKKIKSITYLEKAKLHLAYAIIKKPKYLFYEEPLDGLDNKTARWIINNLESLADEGTQIITTSPSFRNVVLLPGNSYHLRNESVIPIYESIEDIVRETVPTSFKLEVKVNGRSLYIDPQDILYAESIESVCNLFIKNSYIPTQFTLEELESKLKDHRFYRSHRSYLVNTLKVKEIQQWTRNSYAIVLEGEEEIEIPLSKRRLQDFKDYLHSA